MDKLNEFKFSTLRQFGSENVSFTATILSSNLTLTEKEIVDQINQIDMVITNSFEGVQKREISEKALLAKMADRRREEVAKLDDALKAEMETKKKAEVTMAQAKKASNKLIK
jgi:hypothetical protein